MDGAIAARKTDKTDEETAMTDNNKALTAEEDYRKEIKPDCDFIIDNFASRSEKRTAEMDGLRQAKEFLAGAASLAQAPKRSLRSVHKVAF